MPCLWDCFKYRVWLDVTEYTHWYTLSGLDSVRCHTQVCKLVNCIVFSYLLMYCIPKVVLNIFFLKKMITVKKVDFLCACISTLCLMQNCVFLCVTGLLSNEDCIVYVIFLSLALLYTRFSNEAVPTDGYLYYLATVYFIWLSWIFLQPLVVAFCLHFWSCVFKKVLICTKCTVVTFFWLRSTVWS